MFDVGRICVKIAGRDAKGYCVIVDVLDNNYVLIDGGVRRRKVNTLHLVPLDQTIDIKKGASLEEVKKAFDKLGYPVLETKPKEVAEKPRRIRKVKPTVDAKPKAKPIEKKPVVKKEAPSAKQPVKDAPKPAPKTE